jgi:nitrogenase-stabilizing/protective protein
MTVLEQLSKLSSAEEFFQFLEVPYDPAVLNVARLHILRRMGDNLRNCSTDRNEEALRENLRAGLEQAYQDFVCSTPLKERVFKVLKDAVGQKAQRLVPLSIPSRGRKSNCENDLFNEGKRCSRVGRTFEPNF